MADVAGIRSEMTDRTGVILGMSCANATLPSSPRGKKLNKTLKPSATSAIPNR